VRFNAEAAATTRDGLDVDSLELPIVERAALNILSEWPVMQRLREIGGGTGLEAMARRAMEGSLAVGLVRVPGNGPEAFVRGGRAVQRIWLTATALQLAVHPWTALPYLIARLDAGEGFDAQEREWFAMLAQEYRSLFPPEHDSADVMLWRISRAELPTARSLRRPIDDVFRCI
jgi:hypothetical protein